MKCVVGTYPAGPEVRGGPWLRYCARHGILALAFCLCIPAALRAQRQGGDTLRLSTEEAAARALARNPEIARRRLDIERARAEARRVRGFFPSLPELGYDRTTDAPFEGRGEGGWDLGIRQEIELGGQYALRGRIADAEIARTELETRSAEIALQAEARGAFARLLAAQERLLALDSLNGFSVRLDTLAARLLQAGEISELSRNVIKIERTQVGIERINASATLAVRRVEINLLLAAPGRTVIVALRDDDRWSARSIQYMLDSAARLEAALAIDDAQITRRPDVQALDRVRQRLELERSLALRRFIPNVTLGLALRRETTVLRGEDLTGGSDAVRNGFGELRSQDQRFGFHLGIALPIPLPGLYNLGDAEAAVADVGIARIEADRRLLVARIRSGLARVAGRLRAASEVVGLYREGIAPLIARNLPLLERGYAAGELSATEVVLQQEQLLRTSEALIAAEQEFDESVAEFQMVTAQ